MTALCFCTLHGLVVGSDIDLHHGRPGHSPAELTMLGDGHTAVSHRPPRGRMLAQRSVNDTTIMSIVETDEGDVLHIPQLFQAVIDRRAGLVRYTADARGEAGIAPILLAGSVLSAYLLLEGAFVLHASAVHVDALGGAVAVVGSSGMGKSTVATLLAAAGGRLITDDVLRLDAVPGGLVCRPGATETRLRDKTRELIEQLGRSGRATADGRLAVAFEFQEQDSPLVAVLLPRPSPDRDRVELDRLSGVQALQEILRHPRLPGWIDPVSTGRQFAATASLVRTVPVYEAWLPWGPPFPHGFGEQILTELAR